MRPLRPILAALVLATLLPGALLAQTPSEASDRFAAAWGRAELEGTEPLFAESVRLTLEGRTHTGVRGRQVVATLSPIVQGALPAAPLLLRMEGTGDGTGAYAEYRWESLDRDTGAPVGRTVLLIFENTEAGWRISELRLMP